MKTEIWECDHCGTKESTQGEYQFIHILLTNQPVCNNVYNLESKCVYTQLWCKTCIEKSHMNVRYHQLIKNARDKEKLKEQASKSFAVKIGVLLEEQIYDEVQEQMSDQ